MAVAAGEIDRLMLFLPPRSGKSELASRYFPAWFVGLWPDKRVILTSYEAGFAELWGAKARDILAEFGWLFGVKISKDSAAASHWDVKGHAGGMDTAGIGGPITGKGADVLIIDDPIKNQEEADSSKYREKIWDWFQTTAYTRLEPKGAIILVMTRWHPDDLAGRLVRQMDSGGEHWEVVSLPALAEENDLLKRMPEEPLWPTRFDKEALLVKKKTLGPRRWAAMYQQRPVPQEGTMFRREWFGEPVNDYPKDAHLVRYWDLAATEEGDYTAGVLVAEKDGIYHVIDVQRFRLTAARVEQRIRQIAEQDLERGDVAIYMEQEPGASGKIVIDHYARSVLQGFTFKCDKTSGSKVSRARPVSSAAELKNVKLVQGTWIGAFLEEADVYPHGEYDDQIDALSGAFAMLAAAARKNKIPIVGGVSVGRNTRWNSSAFGGGRITRR